MCGFQDHFVATHMVAFARDQGIGSFLAGNLFAFMGLFGLIGVLGSGYLSDRSVQFCQQQFASLRVR